MCRQEFARALDSCIFPGMQGGPLMHVISAKAVAMSEAAKPEFKDYQRKVVRNAKALANALLEKGFTLVSGGTDNHLILVDLTNHGITGAEAQQVLEAAGMTVNKNTIPFDPLPPSKASGIRIGTPAVTTRSMGPEEMRHVASLISDALTNRHDERIIAGIREQVRSLCDRFPLYAKNGDENAS
jgi:glycine hydroxymethyltransferase